MTNPPQKGISPEEMQEVDELAKLIDKTSASNAPTSQSLQEIFGEPISVYTDTDAIEDGLIVDLTQFTRVLFHGLPINRMTRHLFDDLEPFAQTEAETLYDGNIRRAFSSILSAKIGFASGDPGNTGEIGDIFSIPPKLWLVRNEVGGWTAMYPEDY